MIATQFYKSSEHAYKLRAMLHQEHAPDVGSLTFLPVKLREFCERLRIDPNDVFNRSQKPYYVMLKVAFCNFLPADFSPVRLGQFLNYDHATVYHWRKRHSEFFMQEQELKAIAFIPNPENKPCINHLDGDTLNNDLSNLEWCTYAENMKHAIENNLIDTSKNGKHGCHAVGSNHGRTSLIEHEVLEIRERSKGGESGRNISKDYPISDSAVYDIINRKSWTHI